MARMEGKLASCIDVWLSIKHWVGVLSKNVNVMAHVNEADVWILNNLDVQIANKRNKAMQVVRWLKPRQRLLKINLDGSSLGNSGPAGDSGILRDYTGSFIFGFSKFFSSCSNNEAEVRVVLEGINLCKQLDHNDIDIECDSNNVVNLIRSRKCSLWYLWDFWKLLISLLKGVDFSIKHLYGEGNKVANALVR